MNKSFTISKLSEFEHETGSIPFWKPIYGNYDTLEEAEAQIAKYLEAYPKDVYKVEVIYS